MIWFVFIILTAAVLAGLMLPVLRGETGLAVSRADFDKAVFKDQLAEVDRDVSRGMIGPEEANAARNEISRRLLQAAQQTPRVMSARPGFMIPVVAAVGIPVLAAALYANGGTPGLPDVPRATRMANAQANGDFVALVAQVEERMAVTPDDLKGWQVLAPAYRREQRWQDAANAFANILRLSPPDAPTFADYGEMLVLGSDGAISPEARKAFAQALTLDPKEPKSRFFTAIAMKQEGKIDDAKAALTSLLADAPADAPWRGMVDQALTDMTTRPPALSQDQMAAGAAMSSGDQQQMIRTMVDGLDAKLKADPNNLDGWLRLVRARTVLGETDRAKEALATARTTFRDQPDAITALDGLAKELNLL